MQKYHFLHFDSLDLLSLFQWRLFPPAFTVFQKVSLVLPVHLLRFILLLSCTFGLPFSGTSSYRMVPELNTLKSSLSMGGVRTSDVIRFSNHVQGFTC